jgi:hypothetical protein
MTEPTLQMLIPMMQQLLNAQHETAAEILDMKLCIVRIEHHVNDGAKRHR